ncbi:YozE family protein [Streptomyces sp. S1]|uniref:YozE family protein n=1 Tax=Streptomyces sp. S1 TaxID=718288 RepID=UPI001F09176A|nr:YozE family protein [Streptomyces sp. S1]
MYQEQAVPDAPKNFRTWLMEHVGDDTPLGDLARDVRADRQWPQDEPESFELYNEHLESMRACSDALVTLKEAWGLYEGIPAQA